ncbi:MAG: glycosyltransferase family 2 protein [Acidimicrobiales bacterium]
MPVVIVHWNQPQRCLRTIEALRSQTGVEVVVTVVDNGSHAEAIDTVRATGVEVLALGENRGFGPAANVGFQRWLDDPTRPDWVGLAPHDALPAPDCLARLLAAAADRPRPGLACADYGDGATPVVDPYFGGILAPATVAEGWEPAGYPHGTLMLARRACLHDVGLFDERYFAYGEEADLGLRATTRGWECGLVRGAMVANPNLGSTLGTVDYLMLRNTLLLVREHSGRYHAFIRFCIAIWHLGAGAVRPARRGPYWHPRGRLLALRDFLTGRYGPPPASLLHRR